MAKLRITNVRIDLTRDERLEIQRNLEDLAKANTKPLTKSMAENFKRRKVIRGRIDNILVEKKKELNQLRNEINEDYKKLDASLATKVKKIPRASHKKRSKVTNAVWGLPSGVERPRYDLSWTYHDIVGTPLDYQTTADPNTGNIVTYAHGHDSSPKMVDSYAGVGFWYIPNRFGTLHIGTAPSLSELMWTGADWNDVAAAGGWISLGIASYLRDPFRFDRWEVIKRDLLWWNEDNWFDWTDHDRDVSAYGMSVNTIADTRHYYACWQWIQSYIYAEDGGSYAGSYVSANVGGFTYSFI
jgi:hypothetical protein